MYDYNERVVSRTYVTMGEIEYYNFSAINEQVLFALNRFFDVQRKAKNPLFIGKDPIDKSWNWVGIQLIGLEWLFVDQNRVTVAHTIKYMRECIHNSMQVLTPPTK